MSDRDNKSNAVWQWLYGNENISSMFFNFSTTDENDTVIAPIVSDYAVKKYVDGTSVRQYDFAVIQYRKYNSEVPNVTENVETIFDVEKAMAWIEEQNRNRNFPEFPDGCVITKVENLQDMPEVAGINETNAKYMFSCRISYVERAK